MADIRRLQTPRHYPRLSQVVSVTLSMALSIRSVSIPSIVAPPTPPPAVI